MEDLIKLKIIEILQTNDDLTLTGFMAIPDFADLAGGDRQWFAATQQNKDSNILLLRDIKSECINAFNALKVDKIINLEPTTVFVAATEGLLYNLPTPTELKVHKEKHWLPTLVKKGENFPKN
jgi:hypothetical protein